MERVCSENLIFLLCLTFKLLPKTLTLAVPHSSPSFLCNVDSSNKFEQNDNIHSFASCIFLVNTHAYMYIEYLMWYTIVLMYHNFFYQHAWMNIFVIFTWCYEQYWNLNHCIFSYMCRYIFCLTKYIDLYIFYIP